MVPILHISGVLFVLLLLDDFVSVLIDQFGVLCFELPSGREFCLQMCSAFKHCIAGSPKWFFLSLFFSIANTKFQDRFYFARSFDWSGEGFDFSFYVSRMSLNLRSLHAKRFSLQSLCLPLSS